MTSPYGKGDTSWFTEVRLGMFIHWGLYALPARHEWVRSLEKIENQEYDRYFAHFNPDLYDPAEWARTAREAGMRYMVITTKHHEGFCLFDSKHTDYKATRTPYGKDLIRPMVEAFRAEGLRVGFYYSVIDWHHPEFPIDRLHPQTNDQAFREQEQHRDIEKYAEYLHNQTRELITEHQPDVIWFDFSYPGDDGKGRDDWQSEKLVNMVRQLKPDILINDRLDLPGSEDFFCPEQFVPDAGKTDEAGRPVPWESCQTFSGSWGYHRDESSWKSVHMLIQMLVENVARGGNLLLNVGPTARGELDHRALERLKGLGEWMKRHSQAIYGCAAPPAEFSPPNGCEYTYNPAEHRLYLHLFTWPFKHIHLPGMKDKVEYAQLLNDASEIQFRSEDAAVHAALNASTPDQAVTLDLPVLKPPVEIPVIELFLK